jgi:hypothetical protein
VSLRATTLALAFAVPAAALAGHLAPLTLSVSGPEAVHAGQRITLDVTIHRRGLAGAPIQLATTLPAGATWVAGALTEIIPDDGAHVVTRRIELQLGSAVPAGDVVVTMDVTGAAGGLHATAVYRFGRPEPRLPTPRFEPHPLGGRVRHAVPLGQP